MEIEEDERILDFTESFLRSFLRRENSFPYFMGRILISICEYMKRSASNKFQQIADTIEFVVKKH